MQYREGTFWMPGVAFAAGTVVHFGNGKGVSWWAARCPALPLSVRPWGAKLGRQRPRRNSMPKYLVQASYIGDGVQGLRQEGGSARRAVVEKACSSVGGNLDAFYYAFGETDVVTIMDLPDNVTAAGVALLVAASGRIDIKTTVLLTPEEVDAAVKVGGDYRPPGG
jgi:uncharacterized protein with GYD domain